jgi:hypothetical protein
MSTCFSQGQVGSPYTRYSIGDINCQPLIRNNAMGGLSYTLISNNNINFVNPAGIANIDTLTFIFDFGLNGGVRTYSILNPESSISKNDYQISYVNFGFAATKWWKLAIGVAPYSNVSYNISKKDSSLNNIVRTYNYNGSGGVSRVYWTNAFKPFKKINLKVGITTSFLFGEILHNNSAIFKPTNDVDNFSNFWVQDVFRVSSLNFEAGLQYDIKINEKNTLLIGLVSNFNNNLRSFKSGIDYNKNSVSNVVDTIAVYNDKKGTISVPYNIGAGIGYVFNDRLYVGIDAKYQDWSKVNFFGQNDTLKNAYFLNTGLEYVPGGYNGNVYKYWQYMKFRLGGYFSQSYFKLNSEQYPINDFGITFGLGFPMKRSKTSFDISFKLGQRGSLQNNLIRERYIIAGVSFNLSDVWFVKSKFD